MDPQGKYMVTTNKAMLDINMIHDYLCNESYWSKGIPLENVKKAIHNSLNFGLYLDEKQLGYARVISDFSTVAYLGDVFIVKEYRGKGLSKLLLSTVMKHPDLQNLRRWILLTRDAHALYRQFGWSDIADPGKWMELHNAGVYLPS